MSLRARIYLTLAPLLVLLAMLGLTGVVLLNELGGRINAILRENYDSVRAMQQLNEALERIDSSFQFALLAQNRRTTPGPATGTTGKATTGSSTSRGRTSPSFLRKRTWFTSWNGSPANTAALATTSTTSRAVIPDARPIISAPAASRGCSACSARSRRRPGPSSISTRGTWRTPATRPRPAPAGRAWPSPAG